MGVDTARANCQRWERLALCSSWTTSHPAGLRVNMLRARPEVLVLLGVLLSLLLDPTGKYQALVPLGVGEGIGAGKRLPAAGIWGEIAARLSEMVNFPAQPRGRGSISTWVGLGALSWRTEAIGSPRGRRKASSERTTL